MKQSITHQCRLAFSLSAISLLLVACATDHEPPPIGAYTENDQPSEYPVEVVSEAVDFTIAPSTQQMTGLNASVSVPDLRPVLYYRYDIDSKVVGDYVLMPNPPRLFTVRKAPYYRVEPASARIHINLHNTSDHIVRMNGAACALDLNGHTISSVPLNTPDLLPGHDANLAVDGPTLGLIKATPTGTLTVWVYGFDGADKDKGIHWTIGYNYSQQDLESTGEIVLSTSSEQEADSYRNREDRADPAGDNP
jgi:hypothetical protein